MPPDPRHSNTALSEAEKPPVVDVLSGEVPILMQGVVAVYNRLGWNIISYQHQDSILEKDYGLCWGLALAMLPIPMIGLAALISNMFLRRHYRMHLTLIGQGEEIEIRGHGMRTVLNRDNIAMGGLSQNTKPYTSLSNWWLDFICLLSSGCVPFVVEIGRSVLGLSVRPA